MKKSKVVYFVKKIANFFISIFILSIIVFVLSRLTPIDPLQSYYGERVEKMSSAEKLAARERLGLNDSIPIQYVRWIQQAFQGDFGISYKYKQDVWEVISGRIGNTLLLGGLGFVIIFIGSLALGMLCARKENGIADRIVCKCGTILSCIPEFWMALVLISVFCVMLQVLPSSGAYSLGKAEDIGDRMKHLILPLTVVVLEHLWYYAYMVRNKILEEVREDYVLLCRAIGLSKNQILFRHCVRNVMPAYLSIMAIAVPHILGGTYIVETVFSYPGIGSLSYESARFSDYNMLMVLCMLTGILVIFFNILAQIINERIDSRMKANEMTGQAEITKQTTGIEHTEVTGS